MCHSMLYKSINNRNNRTHLLQQGTSRFSEISLGEMKFSEEYCISHNLCHHSPPPIFRKKYHLSQFFGPRIKALS